MTSLTRALINGNLQIIYKSDISSEFIFLLDEVLYLFLYLVLCNLNFIYLLAYVYLATM